LINISDVIILDIQKEDIYKGIEIVKKEFEDEKILIDNLRDRNKFVSFDCRIRGYLGELGIKRILDRNNISYTIDSSPKKYKSDIDLTIHGLDKKYMSEIKTSSMPDGWASNGVDVFIRDCINKGDIKIFKWENDEEFKSINREIYIQIYFREKTKERDKFTIQLSNDFPDLLSRSIAEIYERFQFQNLIENTFFVAWVDKKSLINRLEQEEKENRYYSTGDKRQFWKCKIIDSKSPSKFIEYLNMKCPLCDAKLIIRKNSKNGTSFLGCANYPKCGYHTSWKPND